MKRDSFFKTLELRREEEQDLLLFQAKWQLRQDVFHIFLLGGTGSGKSTFLNALASENIVKEGVVRPTTSRIQLWCHKDFREQLQSVDADFIFHENKNMKDIAVWDFPDHDSHVTQNHKYSQIFREYADFIFLIMHPEKYRQQSLQTLLQAYPKIPCIGWITHKNKVFPAHRQDLEDSLKEQGMPTWFVDLKEDPKEVITLVRSRVFSMKSKEREKLKMKTLFELAKRVQGILIPVQKQLQSFLALSSQQKVEESQVDFLIQEKLKTDWIDIWDEMLFKQGWRFVTLRSSLSRLSWFSLPAFFLSQENSVMKSPLPLFTLPLIRLEEEMPGILFDRKVRDRFIFQHKNLMEDLWNELVRDIGRRRFLASVSDLLLDWAGPFFFFWFIMIHASSKTAALDVFTWIVCVFFLFIFFWIRVFFFCRSRFGFYREIYISKLSFLVRDASLEQNREFEENGRDIYEDLQAVTDCLVKTSQVIE